MAPGTDEFRVAAQAFRAALAAEDVGEGAFARHVRDALARVYLAAALLGPPGDVESDAVADSDEPASRAGRAALQKRLEIRFGEHDVFIDVYDPSRLVDGNVEPIERSLSQELVEVDMDLAEAIAALGEGRVDALWDAQWAFENHWGSHALACLRPLDQMAAYGVV